MANDIVMPSDSFVAPVEKEELEEALLDVNVFQRSHEEEPSRRMVRIRVNCSTWNRQWSPNPHALTIYLEFVPIRGAAPKRFEECSKMTMFVFIVELGFPMMAIIIGYEAQSTPFPWSIELNI
jgi:hypothetical protein